SVVSISLNENQSAANRRLMKRLVFLALAVALVISSVSSLAENTANPPAPRDETWVKRHEGFVVEAEKGSVDLLFLGASIPDGWRNKGRAVWDKNCAPRHA